VKRTQHRRDPRDRVSKTGNEDICPVCGILRAVDGFPMAMKHIYGPVHDIQTGMNYVGHPVLPDDPLAVRVEEL